MKKWGVLVICLILGVGIFKIIHPSFAEAETTKSGLPKEFKVDGEKEIIVSDIEGKIIYKKVSSEKIVQLDMSDKANGMYFVKINVNGEQYIRRIIKE